MAKTKKTPSIVSEWRRNERELIRVTLGEYCGQDVIDVRTWWLDGRGKYRPGQKGITLQVRHTRNLYKGLKKAYVQAKNAGLLGTASGKGKTR